MSAGEVLRSVEVEFLMLPWSREPTDAACIEEAWEDLWFDRFEAPADARAVVREP